jgi:hypothetical protein
MTLCKKFCESPPQAEINQTYKSKFVRFFIALNLVIKFFKTKRRYEAHIPKGKHHKIPIFYE